MLKSFGSSTNKSQKSKLPHPSRLNKVHRTKRTTKRAAQISTIRTLSTTTQPPHKNDPKLLKIRQYLGERNIDAVLIPLADNHLSEYVPGFYKRLEFISEFDGSAGLAIISQEKALLFTDARYFLQAQQQLSPSWTLMKQGLSGTPTITQWVKTNLKKGQTFAFDPWTVSIKQARGLIHDLSDKSGINVLPTTSPNLIDHVWGEYSSGSNDQHPGEYNKKQPELVFNKMRIFNYSGETMSSKLSKLRTKMYEQDAKAMIVVALDEIAWLTSLRGSDVEFNPVFLSYAIITHDKTHLFVNEDAISQSPGVLQHLHDQGNIVIHPYDNIIEFTAKLNDLEVDVDSIEALYTKKDNQPLTNRPTPIKKTLHKIWIDQDKTNHALLSSLGLDENSLGNSQFQDKVIFESNPIGVLKATKNKTEIAAMKSAHIRDAVAVSKLLAWFETQYDTLPCITSDHSTKASSPLDEFSLAMKLDWFRSQQSGYIGPSFDTISSIGPNAAIIHYKPDSKSSSPITRGQVLLLDSGGSYVDATTDITRTFFIPSAKGTKPYKTVRKSLLGEELDESEVEQLIDPTIPTSFQKEVFTRVLQGHVNVATAIWPHGTSGPVLDVLARSSLWQSGLDCPHGIGHGVGAGICVHESPIAINKPSRNNPALGIPLVEGMILSNEPGYYRDGDFGVRIENLVNVVPKKTKFGPQLTPSSGSKENHHSPYLGFDNLTLVPLDRTLIDMELMRPLDINYVDSYHALVKNTLAPLLQDDPITSEWLERNTQPL